MNFSDIALFIDHWHQAIVENLTTPEDVNGLAANLKDIVRSSSAIQGLATNPLLCAMMCALHRDRFRQLPTDRIELYEACCAMLLEKRDVERGIFINKYPKLSYRQKRVLLNDLAYYLMKNGWSEIPIVRAVEHLKGPVSNLTNVGYEIDSHNILQMLLERSGLVREPTSGYLDFAHRTFQEFLAAQEAIDQGDIGLLLRNSVDDQWREVIILAAGLAGKDQRRDLIQGLLAKGDEDPNQRHQMHLLAVACLETVTDIDEAIQVKIDLRLQELIPPTNMTEAKALASAGKLAISQLAKCKNARANEAAAAVRSLSLIGGNEALKAIEGFKLDKRQKVVNELVRAWDFFDRDEYGDRVIRYLKPGQLTIISPTDVKYVLALETLTLNTPANPFTQVDLMPLSQAINLYHLTLKIPNTTDLSPLANLPRLHILTLEGITSSEQIHEISNLPITSLILDVSDSGFDMEDLQELQSIVYLRLSFSKFMSNFSFHTLETLSNLQYLSIYPNSQFNAVNFEGVENLSNLMSLDIGLCNNYHQVNFLSHLRNLQYLSIRGNMSLEDLRELPDVMSLFLSNIEELKSVDLITRHDNCQELDCYSCRALTDIESVDKWPNLLKATFVNCRSLKIDDLKLENFHIVQELTYGYVFSYTLTRKTALLSKT